MFEEEIVNGYNISIFRVSKLNGGITMKFYICPESQTVVEVVAGQPAPLTCDGKPMENVKQGPAWFDVLPEIHL